jgi:hypothetical protein
VHAALSDVEVQLNKLLIVAVLLMPIAVWCVKLAATPSYHEFLLEPEAVNSNPWVTRYHEFRTELETRFERPGFHRTEPTSTRVLWGKSGLSIFNRGKVDIFWGELPLLDCGGPLSESVFDLLWEEITTEAEDRMVLIPKHNYLMEHYFVWDSFYWRTSQLKVCTPQVVSLLQREEYHHDYYLNSGVWVSGRNFIWQDSRLVELNLADLFKDSPSNDWYEVLTKEVTDDLRRHIPDADYRPYRQIYEYLITEQGLEILFQPSEVTHVRYKQFIGVVVSWDLMAPFLKPGAPVTIWYEKQLQKR